MSGFLGNRQLTKLRKQFPALNQQVYGRPLVYLDNAATTHKPQVVIDAVCNFYEHANSNVHRGVHALSALATNKFEAARVKVARFINADMENEIVFTKGTTESINLVAASFGQSFNEGDEIIVSQLEHHANIVPWQLLAARIGARLITAPITKRGDLDMAAFQNLLSEKTKLVAVTHISNSVGTVMPLTKIISAAHQVGAKVLVDGAQAIAHMPVDVQAMDCDFYAFSGHKMYGPTGVGVLYGKAVLLEAMPPYQGGGDMIREVTFEKTSYNTIPHKFEAGTPNIAGVIGLGAAVDFIQQHLTSEVRDHEQALRDYAVKALSFIPNVTIIGDPSQAMGAVSFTIKGVHPHDIGSILDQHGVAVRAGHHCTQPGLRALGVKATTRASFALYNSKHEVNALVAAVTDAVNTFHHKS